LKGITAGHHVVELRAMDRNFNTSSAAPYPFQVLAPWYRHPATALSVLLIAGLLAYSAYQHLSRHRGLRLAVDVTTQRLKQEFEEHSRIYARFESILDHAPTSIYVKDLEGRYVISNLRHCEILGRSREQIIGKTDGEIFSPPTAPLFPGGEAEAVAGKRGT